MLAALLERVKILYDNFSRSDYDEVRIAPSSVTGRVYAKVDVEGSDEAVALQEAQDITLAHTEIGLSLVITRTKAEGVDNG